MAAPILASRVKETSTTTGTGTLTLAGAGTGYRTFNSGVGVGGLCYYCVVDPTTGDWEEGIGTVATSTTLARTRVRASSNSGSLVSFAGNAKDVFVTYPSGKGNYLGYDTITATTTLDDTYHTVLCNNSSDITVNLPAAASNAGLAFTVKKVGSNTNLVTLDGNASETIDGATTLVLYVQNDYVRIVSDGSNWQVLADGRQAHKCYLYRNTAQTISNNTDTKITLDTSGFDVGGLGDVATNHRANIRRAGKYLVQAFWRSTNFGSGTTCKVSIYVNGSAVLTTKMDSPFANDDLLPQAVAVLDLAASDYLEVWVWHNQGGNIDTTTGAADRARIYVAEVRP